MLLHYLSVIAFLAVARVSAQSSDQLPFEVDTNDPVNTFFSKYGLQNDLSFTGPLSFAHLPYRRCLSPSACPLSFDIAILGMPFDTAVSYRPGARFGPFGIRAGSRRTRPTRSWTLHWGMNPYEPQGSVIDCGDVPVAISDNALALDQMEAAYTSLLARPVMSPDLAKTARFALDGKEHPRIVTLGGDHTIVLPILRALNKVYGPVTVVHFDSHVDTWPPSKYPGVDESSIAAITHGSFFWKAWTEGLMTSNNVHAGIRCKFSGPEDLAHDEKVGFTLVTTDDIDVLGVTGIVRMIREKVGTGPVYISTDIDVIDPGLAPGTGTPESGGWTSRELKAIIRGLAGLNFVGVDIVEVAPPYDHAEQTSLLAADLVDEFLSIFTAEGPTEEARLHERRWGRSREEL